MKLRLAEMAELDTIWEILQDAIAQRKRDGSEQWQQGYPNLETVTKDIQDGYGYVVEEDEEVVAYAAIIFGVEPNYAKITGKWLSEGDYAVVHRVATAEAVKGKGVATQLFILIEELSRSKGILSIKVDTNFDNQPMLRILEKLSYTYCGEIFFGGATRMAFEKLLG
jgi:GNAT superfamily N-acetyltransferase